MCATVDSQCLEYLGYTILNLPLMPHGMCYSHFGNGVRNGAISIIQWGFINDCYKGWPMGKKYGNGNGVCRSLGAMCIFSGHV